MKLGKTSHINWIFTIYKTRFGFETKVGLIVGVNGGGNLPKKQNSCRINDFLILKSINICIE